MMKVLNLKSMKLLKYQNIKRFLQILFQFGLKKFVWLKTSKTLARGHMLLVILNVKKLLKRSAKTNCKKTNQKKFRVEM